ncbi:MAG: large-conductance mechanosensitive channel protein MscL [Deltaproteobacteria bacterium]|nr:large-conductance mechanosensitive channel protein MscL [Deltaproteobacteria bacterium]
MLKEFKTFALRGNRIDMAAGIIIGGAFGKIVTSLVNDVSMPPIGMLLGGMNFSDLVLRLGASDKAAALKYGNFMQTVVDFLIVAFAIFLFIKAVNKAVARMKQEEAPATKDCPRCCSGSAIKATRCPHCTSELEPAGR